MVRYRPEAGERGYTFRLNNSAYSGSPTGTISDHGSTIDSSIYKERIDSLFRERQHRQNDDDDEEEDEDNIKANQPTMEHLKLHFQKVMAEQRNGTSTNDSAGSKNNSTTYIQINNQVNNQSIVERAKTPLKSSSTVLLDSVEHVGDDELDRSQRFTQARNAVQAKIAKMFEESNTGKMKSEAVTFNSGKAVINIRSAEGTSATRSKQQMPLPPIPVETSNPDVKIKTTALDESTNRYKVDYLGGVALPGRATSLESLQFPLKDLYAKYRRAVSNELDVCRGTMDISAAGLKVSWSAEDGRLQETLNPFATIAVWAAVKFVWRSELTARGMLDKKFAFLPLICDPENQDKQNLFHALHSHDVEWLTSAGNHPPIFTCVMRNMNAPKTLECHAFVCDNPEDAIVIAANLYQALLRNMKTNAIPQSKSLLDNTPTMTTVNQSRKEAIYSATSVSNWSESSAASGIPVRPPRRKKKCSEQESSAGVEKRRSIRRNHSKTRSSQGKANLRRSMRGSSRRSRVKRTVSERQMDELLAEPARNEILTKVAIPRSKSFVNVPQNYTIAELFEELQKHEGINSVDDVLKMIVSKDRMSFNDLSPTYKEMVMKLAVTMSKDEMFERSQNIMRNQSNNSNNSKAPSSKARDSDAEHSSSSRISSVLRATKKSFSKWSSRSGNGYSVAAKPSKVDISLPIRNIKVKSSATVPTIVKMGDAKKKDQLKTPLPTRSSTVSPVNANLKATHPPEYSPCAECIYDNESCSHKCYCSVSDYQSQTDYSDAEKCYCSLQRVKSSGAPVYQIRLDSDTDTSLNSSVNVARSGYNKPSKNRQNYARKTASLTSWSALSGAESPLTAWRRNTSNLHNSINPTMQHSSSGTSSSHPQSRLTPANASFIRRKSLSSYLSDTSLDSDVVAMTEPVHRFTPNTKSFFAKQPEILRRKSRSSYLTGETDLESMTTSSSSFIRAPSQPLGRKSSPESVGYQSYDSAGTGSSGKTSRNFSLENLASPNRDRRNSNSSSDNSSRPNKKVLMVSAVHGVDTKGKIVYRGTSASQKQHHRSASQLPEGVLSVKKTTEIAAMFSNLKLNQTTDIIIDQSTAEDTDASELSTDDAYSSMKYRGRIGKHGYSKSMENSLGYLP